MALAREIYQALEDIVGPENISDDPADIEAYRSPLNRSSNHVGPYYGVFTPKGEAVLLPGSTEEVQAIVKVCNKYKLKAKASSTFWSSMGYPSGDHTIQLDMRRMDRILEIDEKNQFAVIEPYVIGAQLQAEAMKVGLNTHMIGAGAGCSPLASCSYLGYGPDSIFMGYANENLLGAEWVMPNGEIMRTGSLGSGLGWHYGEGPGPGVRGIFRGALGPMGVITKVALKLYPWPGPAKLPVEGIIPAYRTVLPDNINGYTVSFPTWQAWADACYKIWDAGIGYIAHRQFNKFGTDLKAAMIRIVTDPAKTLSDLEELLEDPEVKQHTEEARYEFEIVLAGMTSRDIMWQEKALDEILAETGGWKVSAMTDPVSKGWLLLYLIRMGHKNLNFVYSGSYEGCYGMNGNPDFGTQYVEEVSEMKREWEKKGNFVAAGGDCMMGGIARIGGGGGVGWENFTHFDGHSKESTEGTFEFFEAVNKFCKEKKLGLDMGRMNAPCRGADGRTPPQEVRNEMFSASAQPVVYQYQKKIKDTFDPNDLGDGYYQWADLK
ncbi:MAG: FAD-binding oxidoreductase [Thermincola sp.]|jgi:glycolate oxidase|nr:FAD-binding oxidoreductase [Thermincola sp.]MDT3704171.1 FAD-binding oxidoreductase [Thermincola sp.]